MDIVIAATVPGLLAALDAAGHQRAVTRLLSAQEVLARLGDPQRPLDAVVLDTGLSPLPEQAPGEGIAETLWYLLDAAAQRSPRVPVLLLLPRDGLPPRIRDYLMSAAQATGGEARLLPAHAGPQVHAETVQWLLQRLHLPPQTAARWLMPLSAAGGVGKTTQTVNLALALQRRWQLRVLLIDADFVNGSLHRTFKVPPGAAEPFLTLRQEVVPTPHTYPLAPLQRRIYHHPSGIDLLLSGRGLAEYADMTYDAMQALLRAVQQLPYDLVVLDSGPDIKARPYAVDVLISGGTGLVLCPAGAKGYDGARHVLDLLRQITAPGRNSNLLDQAALLCIDAEKGSVADVRVTHATLMRQYPQVLDLGIVPRDAGAISMVEEREGWATVYDVAPRSVYARAMARVADQVLAQLQIAPPAAAPAAQAQARASWWPRLGRRAASAPTEVAYE